MTDLRAAEKRLNVKKAALNIEELEFKILERMADIERIKENIKKQEEHILKLEGELEEGK
jgi:hypothetical protein